MLLNVFEAISTTQIRIKLLNLLPIQLLKNVEWDRSVKSSHINNTKFSEISWYIVSLDSVIIITNHVIHLDRYLPESQNLDDDGDPTSKVGLVCFLSVKFKFGIMVEEVLVDYDVLKFILHIYKLKL